jgi:IS30 family transposase
MSHLFTATDRASLMEWIVKLDGKNAEQLAAKAIEKLLPLKDFLFTMTSDNRKEFAEHRQISKILDIRFYFADLYKSCQRGLN